MTDETTTYSVNLRHRGDRRRVRLRRFLLGAALIAVISVPAGLYSASLPNSWYRNLTGHHLSLEEPPSIVRMGRPADFAAVGVCEGSMGDGCWIVRLPENKLIAIHTFCTHDGCATSWVAEVRQYGCPCCGSRFEIDGTILSGPAERPLERFKIYLQRESILVNRSETFQLESGGWQVQGAFLKVDDD
jgi:cytochrome b6-f complex iron-sulfur subunit